MASLDDKKEVARLAEEAEGRKFFFRFVICCLFSIPRSILCAARGRTKVWLERGMYQSSLSVQIALFFWGILDKSEAQLRLLRQSKLPLEKKQSLIFSLEMIRRNFYSRSFWQSWTLSILTKLRKFQPKPTFLCWVLRLPTKFSPTWTPSSGPALLPRRRVALFSLWETLHTVC